MYTSSISFYSTNASAPYLHMMVRSDRFYTEGGRTRQSLSVSSWYLAVALMARPFCKGMSS